MAGVLLQLWGFVLIPTMQSIVEPFATGWDPLAVNKNGTGGGLLSVSGTDLSHPRMYS